MSDNSKVGGEDMVDVTVHPAPLQGDDKSNLSPAFEEGPHLQDPEVRAAKKKTLQDAGITADHEGLTDDMKAILSE